MIVMNAWAVQARTKCDMGNIASEVRKISFSMYYKQLAAGIVEKTI